MRRIDDKRKSSESMLSVQLDDYEDEAVQLRWSLTL